MKYIIQYTSSDKQQLQIGIEANNRQQAIKNAETCLDEVKIRSNKVEVPPLFTLFEETSLHEMQQRNAAFEASHLLQEAFQHNVESDDLIDCAILNKAYQAALKATQNKVPQEHITSFAPCQQLVVVVKNGVVQSVMADRPDAAPAVMVIDYNVDGAEFESLRHITQPNGNLAGALVAQHHVDSITFNLNEVFQKDT